MHYVDEGDGDPVLCLHGEPTWSYLYRKMIPGLSTVARVVAPDYFGFGRSDKPTDRDWYSFDRHYGSILGLVETLGLRRLTVVVQDWGGPIGMRLAVEQPERVARLVILNTGVGGGRAPNEVWLRFREVVRAAGGDFQAGRLIRTASVRDFPTSRGRLRRAVPHARVEGRADHVPRAGADRARASEHCPDARDPRGDEGVAEADACALRRLRSDLPAEVAERFAELIPGALPAETIANAGHFVQEDAGEEVAARIVRFLEET